jgi:hypothetical protein
MYYKILCYAYAWSVPVSNTLWDKTVLISFGFALVHRISGFALVHSLSIRLIMLV